MNDSRKRIEMLDVLRGIATVEVVMCHALQRAFAENLEYGKSILYRLADWNQMFLYFVISGFLFGMTNPTLSKGYIVKKFRLLVVTTYVWTFIIYFPQQYDWGGNQVFIDFQMPFVQYLKGIIRNPLYIYWFLFVLFLFTVGAVVVKKIVYWLPLERTCKKIVDKDKLFAVILLFIGGSIAWMPLSLGPYLGASYTRYYFPFFALGIALYVFREWRVASFIGALLYGIILSSKGDIRYIRALLIIILLTLLAVWICKSSSIIKRYLILQGKYSLEIYVISLCIMNIGIGSGWIKCLTNYIFVTIIATYVAYLITEKTPKIGGFLFGRQKKYKTREKY